MCVQEHTTSCVSALILDKCTGLYKKEWVHYCLFQALKNVRILSVSIYVEDLKSVIQNNKTFAIHSYLDSEQ